MVILIKLQIKNILIERFKMSKFSRRDFIKSSALTAAFIANSSFAYSFKDEVVDFIVYDTNSKTSKNYANSFKNIQKFAINGDVSEIYFELKDKFKHKFIASGFTSKETLFVIENIAKDYGYGLKKQEVDEKLVSWILVPNLKRSLV